MAMREDSLVLVTPTHKADFSEQERVNLELSIGFNSNLTHWFLVPDYLDTTKISQMFSKSKIKKMPGRFFESTKTYNNLMLSEVFYQEFLEYKYLLILQTDALLLRPVRSEDYISYDYIGAPWRKTLRICKFRGDLHANNKRLFWLPFLKVNVGNGGLSIRKVAAFIELLQKSKLGKFDNRVWDGFHNEDFVLSYFLKKYNYRIPSKHTARLIFLEEDFETCVEIPEVLGLHAPYKYNPVLAEELIQDLMRGSSA
jgi:hypothetical protein